MTSLKSDPEARAPSFDSLAIDALVSRALAEDLAAAGDVTSDSVIPADARLSADMVAREPMTVAGLPAAEAAFKRLDPACTLDLGARDGDSVQAGHRLMSISGTARGLLTAERTALNIVQHLSGIATLTRRYVTAIRGTGATLLDTRKTHAGLRLAEKYATRMGGAANHRIGLYDAVMIKDNHIAIVGDIETAVTRARDAGHTDIEVECDTLDQVRQALSAGATRLLLDNMGPSMLREALAVIKGQVPVEASGGVTLDTIRAIAETGVDYISVGRLTQSAPAIDIGLDFSC